MKKVLMATSALVALGAVGAAPAVAQDRLQLGLGGFMKQEFGYAKNRNYDSTPAAPTQRRGFDSQTDAEVYFRGTLKLDNGISVQVHIELEAEDSPDMIDEQYLRVFGSFGDFRIGSLNNAAYLMSYQAPDFGVGYNEAFIYSWITVPSGGGSGLAAAASNPLVSMQTQRLSADNDSNKIAYFTPRLYGFQFGASYTPDFADNDDSLRNSRGKYRDGLSFALNYDNRFGPLYVAANVGWLQARKPLDVGYDDLEGYNAGFNLGYAGFLVGGGYQRYIKGNVMSTNGSVLGGANGYSSTPFSSMKGTVWNLGASYNFGPGGVSLTYQKGKAEGLYANPGDNELKLLMLSGRYILGPGVSVYGTVARVEYHDDVPATTVGDNKGWATIGGIRVDF